MSETPLDLTAIRARADAAMIPSAPGYEVDNQGRVWSTNHNWRGYGRREVTPVLDADGYAKVRLSLNGRRVNRAVHRLVAEAYLGPRPAGAEIRHLDGVKTHNTPDNLRYGTARENAADREKHGHTAKGMANGYSKLTDEAVREIRRIGRSESQRRIAARLSVSQRSVWRVLNGQGWAHVS